MADTAMIPWSPEVLEGAQPVQPAQAFSPLTDVAQAIPQIKAKQAELQRARDAEQATLAASAAAQRPKIEAAQTALAQPMPTPPTAPPFTEPPSRGLTPFLAPIDGEPAETSIAKLLQGIGLLAPGISGLARGDARAALASMQGALTGWQAGDTIRADRHFADWKAATDAMLAKWDVEHKTYKDLMEQRGKSVEELLTDAKLEALKQGNETAVAAFASGSVEKSLEFMKSTTDVSVNLADLTVKMDAAKIEKDRAQMLSDIVTGKLAMPGAGAGPIRTQISEKGGLRVTRELGSPIERAVDEMIRLRREGKEGSPEWAEALIRVNALKAQVPVPPGAELHRPTDVILGAPGAPVISRAPSPEVATHYMHKETWQGPPVGMTEREIITSKQYVQVPTNRIQALSQGRVVKGLLDTVEDIIQRRVDLFPPKTGKTMKDAAALAPATAHFTIPRVPNRGPHPPARGGSFPAKNGKDEESRRGAGPGHRLFQYPWRPELGPGRGAAVWVGDDAAGNDQGVWRYCQRGRERARDRPGICGSPPRDAGCVVRAGGSDPQIDQRLDQHGRLSAVPIDARCSRNGTERPSIVGARALGARA